MDSTGMSFEAKIAMALGGSSWQSLQSTTTVQPSPAVENAAGEEEDEYDIDEEDDEDGDDGVPLEMEDAELGVTQEVVVDEATLQKRKKKLERFEKSVAKDAGEVLETITTDALAPVPQTVAWDQDPELLCCYNWQSSTDGTNTIFVPGEPAKWRQPALPHTLERDSGFQYSDYNYARQPRNPYSAMFHALTIMNPRYTFHDVDVLADRNNLRVLLEFAQGKSNGPFRLNLYLVFNTLVIVRRESRWWKHSDGQSYGINFERNFTRTTPDMQDATSHYRAIRYKMGPLNVVCRFEADAYDDGIVPDDLTESEAEAVSGGLATKPTFNYQAPIRVLQKGHIVPTAQMVELKTQAYHPENSSAVQCQDQLWFGRTSLLFTAPYEKETGMVKRIKKEDATERVARWEQTQQEALRKLVTLLTHLRAVLKRERRPNRAVVLVREAKGGPIVLRTLEERSHAVDRETRERFWPMHMQQQAGGYYRGRGGGGGGGGGPGRAQFNGNRGRGRGGSGGGVGGGVPGHVPPNRNEFPYPRGRGQLVPSQVRGQHHAPRGRGQGDVNAFNASAGRAPTEQRRGPGRGRGGGRGNSDRGRSNTQF